MNSLQTVVGEHNIAKENAKQLIEAFGAPFTEVGKILADYPRDEFGELIVTGNTIVVTDETDVKAMKKARELRLELKKVRTSVENKRKDLKEDSLRTGKAIDGVAKYIKDNIQPVEEYLEKQEKFAEFKELERQMALKKERSEKLATVCDNPFVYSLETMTEEEFTKLFAELVEAKELKAAQEAAYEREQERIRVEKEAEEARLRAENEILRKQAEEREAEIAKEREEQTIVQQAEIASVRTDAEKKLLDDLRNAVNALERITVPAVNGGRSMVDYQAVIQLLEK